VPTARSCSSNAAPDQPQREACVARRCPDRPHRRRSPYPSTRDRTTGRCGAPVIRARQNDVDGPASDLYFDECDTGRVPAFARLARNVRVQPGYQWSTANSRHSSGTPLSSWSPRSSKVMPDPTTRSTTVRDTNPPPRRAPMRIPRRRPVPVCAGHGVRADRSTRSQVVFTGPVGRCVTTFSWFQPYRTLCRRETAGQRHNFMLGPIV
jgi:hypothetical protein